MPSISVLMPIFNCSDTLPFALASLRAQTYRNWECIVVDDGSNDNPEQLIKRLNDPRIKYHPLSRNYGRGYARQRALEIASGEYIAFLDGDDWIMPDKLQYQIELLGSEPDLGVVSTGMAISNTTGQLVGVRAPAVGKSISRGWYDRVSMPPVSFPASMLTSSLAKKTGFDVSFPTAEDTDFLLRAVYGKKYAVLTLPLYVYQEHGAMTLNKVSSALTYCCRMFAKQFDHHPVESVIEIAKARGKQGIYHSASAFGLWDYMIARRSQMPNGADCQQYQNAWNIISDIAAGHAVAI